MPVICAPDLAGVDLGEGLSGEDERLGGAREVVRRRHCRRGRGVHLEVRVRGVIGGGTVWNKILPHPSREIRPGRLGAR